MKGTIIKSTGSWYKLRSHEDGRIFDARIRGKFRLEGKRVTNPVAVGDRVRFQLEAGGETALITEILERDNYVIRQSPRKTRFLHILAANVDQAVVLSTIVQPNLKQGFIDRFLLMTEPFDIPTLILFNKCDLWTDDDWGVFAYLEEIYSDIGYTVLALSAEEGMGLGPIREALEGKTSLFSGHSGVGKSTLINSLQPDLDLATLEISSYSGKGQHTTTFAQMYEMDFGAHIIDTPGIKSLAFIHMEPQDIAHNFREFFALSPNCRFSNCLHLNEPGCAVKEALEEGAVSELRYQNYVTMQEETANRELW